MKFNVEDKVKIRDHLIPGNQYGSVPFISFMKRFLGKTVTISKVIEYDNGVTYSIKEDDGVYDWTEYMFESIKDRKNKPIHKL